MQCNVRETDDRGGQTDREREREWAKEQSICLDPHSSANDASRA